jgi:hypothetical protein
MNPTTRVTPVQPYQYMAGPSPLRAASLFATTDDLAERVRKIGGTTLRSIGHIGRLQRVLNNDADFVTPLDMLAELRDDNKQLTASLRETHAIWDKYNDAAIASLIENWIDEAERRTWFLFEATQIERDRGQEDHHARQRGDHRLGVDRARTDSVCVRN